MASNRLPVTVTVHNGDLKYSKSSGGLVSALSSVLVDTDYKWFGWPGTVVPKDKVCEVEKAALRDHSAVLVHLEQDLQQRFVNGFSSEQQFCNGRMENL